MNLQINNNSFYEAQPTCGKPLLSAAASTELNTKDKKKEKFTD